MTAQPRAWPRHGVWRGRDPGQWFVPSESRPRTYHRVETMVDGGLVWTTCTCEDAEKRTRAAGTDGRMGTRWGVALCKHAQAAGRAEHDDGMPRRPTPRPNVAALCD